MSGHNMLGGKINGDAKTKTTYMQLMVVMEDIFDREGLRSTFQPGRGGGDR
jgi:hypothetical protein